MGVLNNRVLAYKNRVWNAETWVEIDLSSITLRHFRVEHFRNKFVRFLPIHNYVSDKSRIRDWEKNPHAVLTALKYKIKTFFKGV